MIFYVKLTKMEEGEISAKYQFSGDGENVGYLVIDKQTGKIEVLQGIAGDARGQLSLRAAARLTREWRNGHLPDVAEWAS